MKIVVSSVEFGVETQNLREIQSEDYFLSLRCRIGDCVNY